MINKTDFQILYHNVQSLHGHFNDVVQDKLILNSDFICLVETWCLESENYSIPNYEVVSRLNSDHNGKRTHRGAIVFAKENLINDVIPVQ